MPVRSRRRRWVLVASLRELQQLFWRSLADEWDTIAPELVEAVLPSSTLDSSGRVQVYAGAYSSRLLDVLHEDFPRLAALLGRDGFEQIAGAEAAGEATEVRAEGAAFAGETVAGKTVGGGEHGPAVVEVALFQALFDQGDERVYRPLVDEGTRLGGHCGGAGIGGYGRGRVLRHRLRGWRAGRAPAELSRPDGTSGRVR